MLIRLNNKIAHIVNFTVFEDFCLSLSWKYRFSQNANYSRVQSKTNKYCKFHVDLTRRRLSKSRFLKLGMVPKKLYRNTLISHINEWRRGRCFRPEFYKVGFIWFLSKCGVFRLEELLLIQQNPKLFALFRLSNLS